MQKGVKRCVNWVCFRCTKPDAREFRKIAWACAVGFLLMGFIGYFVKLVFIPINNILVGPGA